MRGLLAFAVFLVMAWLGQAGFDRGDEGNMLELGHRLAAGQVPYRDFTSVYPPLSYSPIAAIFYLFGTSVRAVRWALAGLFAFTAWALFGLVSPLTGARTAAVLVLAGVASLIPNLTGSIAHDSGLAGMTLVALSCAALPRTGLHPVRRACIGALAGLTFFVRQNSGAFALLIALQSEASRALEARPDAWTRRVAGATFALALGVQAFAVLRNPDPALCALLLLPHAAFAMASWRVLASRTVTPSEAGAGLDLHVEPRLVHRLAWVMVGFCVVLAAGAACLAPRAGLAAVVEGLLILPVRHVRGAYLPFRRIHGGVWGLTTAGLALAIGLRGRLRLAAVGVAALSAVTLLMDLGPVLATRGLVGLHASLHGLLLDAGLVLLPASVLLGSLHLRAASGAHVGTSVGVPWELLWLNVWSCATAYPRSDIQHVVRVLVTALPVVGAVIGATTAVRGGRKGLTFAAVGWSAWFTLPALLDSTLNIRASVTQARPIMEARVRIPGCPVDVWFNGRDLQPKLLSDLLDWWRPLRPGAPGVFCPEPGLHLALDEPSALREHYFLVPWFDDAGQDQIAAELDRLAPTWAVTEKPPYSIFAWSCPRVEAYLVRRYEVVGTMGGSHRLMRRRGALPVQDADAAARR